MIADIAAGINTAAFDLTGDALVDLADRDAWLAAAGAVNLPSGNPHPLGDANLDGAVDVSDFNVWNGNKFTINTVWCLGDFNADGVVDASDFNIWNANKFTTADEFSRVGATRGERSELTAVGASVTQLELSTVSRATFASSDPPSSPGVSAVYRALRRFADGRSAEEKEQVASEWESLLDELFALSLLN